MIHRWIYLADIKHLGCRPFMAFLMILKDRLHVKVLLLFKEALVLLITVRLFVIFSERAGLELGTLDL